MTSFATKPTLTGELVLLRPIVAADADLMWDDLQDAEAARLTGTHQVFRKEQIDEWCATRAQQADRLDLAVIDRSTGDWAGEVVINEVDVDNRSCNFRIALSANARGRGLGTEATRLITEYVFDEVTEPRMHRISLEVFAVNGRAIRCYGKAGFLREGVRRDALLWEGEFHDALLMSLLRSDRVRG